MWLEICAEEGDPTQLRPAVRGEPWGRGRGGGGRARGGGQRTRARPPPPRPRPHGGPPRLVHELGGVDVLDRLDDRERELRILHRLPVKLAAVRLVIFLSDRLLPDRR